MKDAFDRLKDRMQQHESPINLDDAWARLQQSQNMRKKPSGRRVSLLLLLLLIGSCGSGIWWLSRSSANAPMSAAVDVQHEASNPVLPPIQQNPVKDIPAANPDDIQSTESSLKPFKDEQLTNTDHEAIPQPQKHQMETVSNRMMTAQNSVDIHALEAKGVGDAPSVPGVLEQSGETTSSVVPDISAIPTTTVEAGMQHSAAENITMQDIDLLLSGIPSTAVSEQAATTPDVSSSMQNLPKPAEITRKAKTRRWSVYSGGGAMLQQQTIQANGSENESLAAIRRQTEQALPGFATELGLNYRLNDRFYLEGAFRYQQWYESFKYEYAQPKDYSLQQVLVKVVQYEPIGVESKSYADTVLTGTQTVKITYYNPYSSASLRLGLGANLWSWRRLGLDVAGGLQMDVAQTASGKIAASAQSIKDLTTADGYTSGLGFSAQLPVYYRLNRRLDIQLRPGFATALRSEGSQLKVGFRQGSGLLALRYKF
ncbi:MAG: hypothetical protein IT269_00780 [Saprospiraceae bacterium]|nr:hypothetical protein [Saprospiraceae bacterium]